MNKQFGILVEKWFSIFVQICANSEFMVEI